MSFQILSILENNLNPTSYASSNIFGFVLHQATQFHPYEVQNMLCYMDTVTDMVFLPGHCPMDYRKFMEYAVPPLIPTDIGGRVALRYCN